jgi:NADPH:quinone reductase-like Zn-dependent oxidoreductase
MKLRNRILGGVALVLIAAIAIVAMALAWDAGCEPAPEAPAGAETMQAVVYSCYGGPEVLELATVAKPVPGDDEVLVRVHAASVNPLDWHYMRGSPYIMRLMAGIGRPKDRSMGVDFAGTVEAVGPGVTRFRPGDEVFGGAGGAFAEYVVAGADRGIAHKPANVSFAEAAAVPVAGVTALQALRDSAQVQSLDQVLVNGASGGVGPFAVQLAKHFGAHVTGVASARNEDLVRYLGADLFIDYRTSDYTEGDVKYDVIIDNVGNRPLLSNADVMQDDATLVIVGGPPGNWLGPLMRPLGALVLNPFVDPHFAPFLSQLSAEDMEFLAARLADRSVTPVIDRTFALEEAAEAMRYSEEGHARAKIIIEVAGQ